MSFFHKVMRFFIMNQKFLSAVIFTMPLLTTGNAYAANSSAIQVAEFNQSYNVSGNVRRQIGNRISTIPNRNFNKNFSETIFHEVIDDKTKNKRNKFSYPQGANTRDSFQRYAPNYKR